jgi:hypothetical protein
MPPGSRIRPGLVTDYRMESRRFSLPEQRDYQYAYTQACELAAGELAKIRDVEEQCRRCGAEYRETGSRRIITLEHLNRSYEISLPRVAVSLAASREVVPLKTKVLLLHYLLRAKGTPLSGKMITFKELPEGASYFPTFAKRTLNPLTTNFGAEPEGLASVAGVLDGRFVEYGDVAVTVSAFPHVPLTLVLWRGDSEFAPAASILFDATVGDYLPTEDIIRTCEAAVWTLVKAAKSGCT